MSVRSEPVKVESDTSVEYNAKELATQIVSAHKKIDALIDTLEIPAGEDDDHIKSIVSLQVRPSSAPALASPPSFRFTL